MFNLGTPWPIWRIKLTITLEVLVTYTGLYINKSKWHLPDGSTVPSRDSSWQGTAVGSVIQGTGGPAVLSLLDFTLAVTWWSGSCLSFQPHFWLCGHSPLTLQPSRAAGSTMLVFFSHASAQAISLSWKVLFLFSEWKNFSCWFNLIVCNSRKAFAR